jgi:hypothetical protein
MLELVPPGVDPVVIFGYPLLDLDDVVEVLKRVLLRSRRVRVYKEDQGAGG